MPTQRDMLIGFDATPLEVRHRSGVSRYATELLSALIARNDGRRYALLSSRALNGHTPAGAYAYNRVHFPNRSFWMQAVLPLELRQMGPQLCHFTNMIAPIFAPCPFVLTIHDLTLLLHPQTQPTKSLLGVKPMVVPAIRKAAAIIAVSHSVKQEIVQLLDVDAKRVHVVYEAASPSYRVITDQAELARVRGAYDLHKPFILFVGTVEPRKNLGRLLEAFAQLRHAGHTEQLVMVGQLGWKYGAIVQQIEELNQRSPDMRDSVRLIGYVADDDLPAIYNLAAVVALPSLYEGFGLPILESMACGTPVLTSNISSMAEVGADAVVLVDPFDPANIADGLRRLLTNADLRQTLRTAGLARAREFSWARAGLETINVYEQVLNA